MSARSIRIVSQAALLAFVLSGCASIITGPTQKVEISSDPADAAVEVRDETDTVVFTGTTPATVTLTKKRGYFQGKTYDVSIEKPGYKPFEVTLTPGAGGWYIGGNILIGGLIGWLIVDPLTGAMWTLRPKEVAASLEGQVSQMDPHTLSVVLLEDVPVDMLDQLIRVN